MAHDAGRASREAANGGEARAKGRARRPAPFANHSCWKRLLLQTGLARRRLAADCFWPSRPTFPPPFPQACGGRGLRLSSGTGLSGGQRLLTPVALWLSKQVAAYVRLSYIRVNLYV